MKAFNEFLKQNNFKTLYIKADAYSKETAIYKNDKAEFCIFEKTLFYDEVKWLEKRVFLRFKNAKKLNTLKALKNLKSKLAKTTKNLELDIFENEKGQEIKIINYSHMLDDKFYKRLFLSVCKEVFKKDK